MRGGKTVNRKNGQESRWRVVWESVVYKLYPQWESSPPIQKERRKKDTREKGNVTQVYLQVVVGAVVTV
ncbi:hypothetical protein L2E82_17560 [Cichorium intybus]|uniref:Uncharacterized protein n=1 Tax=Cichorium intybus TaxID=13427 RepID=A0ACB9F908_CICIN|nr:hypothetical protein L2E82_17560 [Cichorium intybus]